MVDAGTLIRAQRRAPPLQLPRPQRPRRRRARRVAHLHLLRRTRRTPAPPTTGARPTTMRATLEELFAGSMRGRTMYVVPVLDGTARQPARPARRAGHRLAVRRREHGHHDPHGHRRPRADRTRRPRGCPPRTPSAPRSRPSEADVAWPCNDTKYISHFPETREIWSFGSAYGGNAMLAKKAFALRIASSIARDEGWLAEHMLLAQGHQPARPRVPRRGGVPERVRQDQLRDAAADHPRLEGRDDRRRHRLARARRRRPAARDQPRGRLLRRRPGHRPVDERHGASRRLWGNTIFTNVALRDDGDVWWEGMTDKAPDHLIDWTGRALDAGIRPPRRAPELAVHRGRRPGARASRTTGRTRGASSSTRSSSAAAVPPTCRWWRRHGTGSTASSWAPRSRPSARRPPRAQSGSCAAIRSRCCRSAATTWPTTGRTGSTSGTTLRASGSVPRIFQVNWFRKGDDGRCLWPGFGENGRVLAWILDRVDGQRRRPSTARSAGCPAPARSTSTARTSSTPTGGAVPHRPDGAPRRGRRRRGVLRTDSATASRRPCTAQLEELRDRMRAARR